MIQFGPETCTDLNRALTKEWLETNGIGGFASSTIAGLNTRRYHGLLTAALHPPVGRMALLAKLEETLVVGGQRFELACNEYPGAIHPQGLRYLTCFCLSPFPTFVYQVAGIILRKTLFMVHGENTTVVRYEATLPPSSANIDVRLELRPLLAFRDYHGTSHKNDSFRRDFVVSPGRVTLAPYAGQPALHLAHDADEIATAAAWNQNFVYRVEQERGLDYTEDLCNPCTLMLQLNNQQPRAVIASTQPHEAAEAETLSRQELARRQALVSMAPAQEPLLTELTAAADQYIVRRGEHHSIIAGYPWFGDWGRDTMISLPGLTLSTGRPEIARSIIDAYAGHVSQGMLPNRFPDAGEQPEYNTVDATLWYFEAIRAWLAHTGDAETVRTKWYAQLRDIIDWHERGTRHGIRMDGDGLLLSGEPGVQLTWMDAKIGDWVVTPRQGKAVEIQALWYNALRIMEELAARFTDVERRVKFAGMAERARESFAAKFWNAGAACLYDVVEGTQGDGAIRPNQIFAISLPHTMLTPEQARSVVEVVSRELLTPLGLCSLSPRDSRYMPHYQGGVQSRDSAYHQGTVWPWLMGPFITAYLQVNASSSAAKAQAGAWLRPFVEHLSDAGLRHISEICDAEAPHTPRGCFAQAWSVAEVLRVAVLLRSEDAGAENPSSRKPRRTP